MAQLLVYDGAFRERLTLARSLGVSEKRLLGWEPKVRQYDADGNLIGWTQAESEWDDHERAKMAALVEYEARICECGLHESVADEDPDLEMPARFCPVCAGIAKNMRIVSAQDEKTVKALGKDPDPAADRPDDGRHFGLRPPEPSPSADGSASSRSS